MLVVSKEGANALRAGAFVFLVLFLFFCEATSEIHCDEPLHWTLAFGKVSAFAMIRYLQLARINQWNGGGPSRHGCIRRPMAEASALAILPRSS